MIDLTVCKCYNLLPMDTPFVPKLQELAEPLTVPGALPEGISLSIGLIATQPAAELEKASRSAASEHYRAVLDAHPQNSVTLERHYLNTMDRVSSANQTQLEEAQNAAAAYQNTLGMEASVGYVPDAEDLSKLFELDERAQSASAASVDDSLIVTEAREDMVRALGERTDATLRIPAAAAQIPLSREIEEDVKRLGRRGWIASTAAGLILGAAATLGFALNHDGPKPPPEAATHTEQVKYESDVENDNLASVVVVSAGTLAAGGVGFGAGSMLRGRFAHRRARSMLRKARRNSSA